MPVKLTPKYPQAFYKEVPLRQPKVPQKVEVPLVANSGPGAAGFVTDRSNDGKPQAPRKMDIPQAQGKTEVGAGKAGNVRPMKQIVPGGTPQAPGAEEFVKNIPQAKSSRATGPR